MLQPRSNVISFTHFLYDVDFVLVLPGVEKDVRFKTGQKKSHFYFDPTSQPAGNINTHMKM